MQKEIITEILSVDLFMSLLKKNPGLVILKLGATWCGPCEIIKDDVYTFFKQSPSDVVCCDIDVDKSSQLYSYLKNKRMVNGIPVLLCYVKGNESYIPDDSITGARKNELHMFFDRCKQYLLDTKQIKI